MTSAILNINSDDDFQRHILSSNNKLIVIDFFATWCGPCKAIAPKFAQLPLKYPAVVFMKVDVDKCRETAQTYRISAMPTFVFLRQNAVKASVSGADIQAVEAKLNELLNQSDSESSATSLVPGMIDLEAFITEKNCLNESEDHSVKNVFEKNKSLFLESDCDPELLLSITFNQTVKLHSMTCVGPPNGHAPKTIRLFINQPIAMDFDSARDASPVQEITLSEEDVSSGDLIPLKFVKLQNVMNVTLFFPDNQGNEETTQIERIVFFGKSINTTNMEEFKRVAGKKGESH